MPHLYIQGICREMLAKTFLQVSPCEEPTFQFASEFGAQSPRIRGVLGVERGAEEIRMTGHWDQVQKQQEEARNLRKVIAGLQQELNIKAPQLEQVRDVERCLRCGWPGFFLMESVASLSLICFIFPSILLLSLPGKGSLPQTMFKAFARSLNSCGYQDPFFFRGKGILKASKLNGTRIFPAVTTSFMDCQGGRHWNKRLQPFRTDYVKRKLT